MIGQKNNLDPKRCLEESNQLNGNSVNNGFNKRAKTDFNCNDITNGLNSLMTNTNSHPMSSVNDYEEDDDLDDELDDGLTDLMSQAAVREPNQFWGRQPSQPNGLHITSQSQYNMSLVSEDRNGDDILMSTSDRSGVSNDAMEGRLKILESKNKSLTEEVNKLKTQSIQQKRQQQRVIEDCNQRLEDQKRRHEIDFTFLRSEKDSTVEQVSQLKVQLARAGKAIPRRLRPEFANQFIQQRNNCQTFSQIKNQEFYAPLSIGITSTQTSIGDNTQSSGSAILVHESQPHITSSTSSIKSPVYSLPSQIPSSQLPNSLLIPVPQPIPMDTTCSESNKTVNNSENMSQSLSQDIKWDSFRSVLENRFNEEITQLSGYYLDQKMTIFDEQCICDSKQINEWVNSFNDLNINYLS